MNVAASDGPPAFLERDESMSILEQHLAGVRASSAGQLVLVGGEAGVGKTTLLREFCAAQARSVRRLWAACEPLRTARPLGPLVDVAQATGGELGQLVAGAARPHEVAASLLAELRTSAPTVLVLEDLHWADEATLDVVTVLAARISSAPALVLASYRDDELGRSQQLRFVLGELVRRPDRLKLQPLSAAVVAELSQPHGIDGEELYRRTGGNPFFVTEVLAAGGERIPETVRDAVLARAAHLPAPARELLEAVAIVPGDAEVWLLESIAGELVARIDDCLAAGVLSAGDRHVAFRHELARLAIEGAVPPNRRLALHRAALAALIARGGDDPDFARLAHHADAAGDVDGVLRWAPRAAARAASSGAHREAAAQYLRALRVADGQSLALRAELLRRRADECYMTSQLEEAIDAQQAALECYRQLGDQRGEGDSLRSLSRLLFFAGRTSEGEPAAQQAVELLERLPAGHELAMAYGNLSQRRMVVEDTEAALAWGNRALELAERLDDTEARIYALTNLGAAEFSAADEFSAAATEARVNLERALATAQRHGLEEYAGRVFLQLVLVPARHRLFDLASRYLEAGLEYCTEHGLDTWRLYLLACGARLKLDLGHWDEAADSAGPVLRDPRSAPVARGLALATLGLLRARRGDSEASAPLREAHGLVQSTGDLFRITPVAAAQGEAAWLSGDAKTVDLVTAAALTLALDCRAQWDAGELACWRWRAGLRDELPAGATAEPYARSIAGEWERAAKLWGKLGCPYEAALALADGDDPVALRQSIAQLQALGARPAAAIVARRMRERGVRGVPRGPRRQTRENPAGLTTRELEVLALLVEGLRNAQIAERLIVSKKTVDHHVSSVLRKLDARTRGEASAEAARLGLFG